MIKLNLGCGTRPLPWHRNVDIVQMPGVDVVCDLNKIPWTAIDDPDDETFTDESADEITGFDIFEHIPDAIGFMTECARILKPDGILYLHTCFWQSENAFTDPTHVHFPTMRTFDYWVKGTEFNLRYGPAYARNGIEFEYVKGYPRLEGTELAVKMRRI
jgi:SAM-dependent methyltransferase